MVAWFSPHVEGVSAVYWVSSVEPKQGSNNNIAVQTILPLLFLYLRTLIWVSELTANVKTLKDTTLSLFGQPKRETATNCL